MGQSGSKTEYIPLQMEVEESSIQDDEGVMETEDDDELDLVPNKSDEGCGTTMVQIIFPFLVAGLAMVAAGLVLDTVQHWQVFIQISEIFILVPALLGLKGNLEMTLASRLSTAANLGKMDNNSDSFGLVVANLSLVQVQGIVVGLVASLCSLIPRLIVEHKLEISHGLLLCASSILTASLASFLLGLVMVFVILASRRCGVNPDNVATPIAAALGDLTTLALLSWIASIIWADQEVWLSPTIITVYLLIVCPFSMVLSWRHEATRPVLTGGWTPVLLAMVISSSGGFILKKTVVRFPGIAVFQPVMNGVGGNLVAVQASRMSTSLHYRVRPGTLPHGESVSPGPPWTALFSWTEPHSKTASLLLAMVLPGQALFATTISYLEAGHTAPTPMFMLVYLLAALLQVSLLLYLCRIMVYWMWSRSMDPDNSAIPYLTALGDFLGGAFLAIAFLFLSWAGENSSVSEEESTESFNILQNGTSTNL